MHIGGQVIALYHHPKQRHFRYMMSYFNRFKYDATDAYDPTRIITQVVSLCSDKRITISYNCHKHAVFRSN